MASSEDLLHFVDAVQVFGLSVSRADLTTMRQALASVRDVNLQRPSEVVVAESLRKELLARLEQQIPPLGGVLAQYSQRTRQAPTADAFAVVLASVLTQFESASGDIAARALRIINERSADPGFSLRALAQELHASYSYVSHVISRGTATSFSRHLLETRLRNACALLLNSCLSVKEIAAKTGFKNVSDFDHKFRRWFGTTPTRYRNSNRRR